MNLLLVAIMLSALPADGRSIFDRANEAYYQEEYEQAVVGYEQLIADYGVKSPALFFNLGNAWFKRGNLGRAVLYYEAALALDSSFEPARLNLETALKNTKRNLPAPDPRQLLQGGVLRYYPLSPMQSLLLTHAALIFALALLVIRYWRETPRMKWLLRCVPAFAAVFFFLALAINGTTRDTPKLAVTVVPEAPVYFSMSELDAPRFVLYEGDRVLVDRIEGDWARVHTHGGERGWTRKDNAGIVEYSGI